MNPILGLIGGGANGNGKMALFMQAIAAASRGESAESFLKGLAQKDPRFQGIDFDNLERAANDICRKKGVDPNTAIEQVKSEVQNLT